MVTMPRNVPLIERRADARQLDEDMQRHRQECPSCGIAKCARYRVMAAELKAIKEELKHWFDPPADAETLF